MKNVSNPSLFTSLLLNLTFHKVYRHKNPGINNCHKHTNLQDTLLRKLLILLHIKNFPIKLFDLRSRRQKADPR